MTDPSGRAAFRLGRGMARTDGADGSPTYVASLPRGPIHVLQGPAALILDVVLRVDVADIVPEVAALGGVAEVDISEDVHRFIDDLEGMGLIERWG